MWDERFTHVWQIANACGAMGIYSTLMTCVHWYNIQVIYNEIPRDKHYQEFITVINSWHYWRLLVMPRCSSHPVSLLPSLLSVFSRQSRPSLLIFHLGSKVCFSCFSVYSLSLLYTPWFAVPAASIVQSCSSRYHYSFSPTHLKQSLALFVVVLTCYLLLLSLHSSYLAVHKGALICDTHDERDSHGWSEDLHGRAY